MPNNCKTKKRTGMDRANLAAEGMKAAPPVAVSAASVVGMTLNDAVLVATLVYVVLQAAFLLYRWAKLYQRGGRDAD